MNPTNGLFKTRVRKPLREVFAQEPNQTVLFNTLLLEYYRKQGKL